MMRMVGIGIGVVFILAIFAQIAGFGVAYTVDETEYAVITQFGAVQRTEKDPGLKFKSPIETVIKFDRRLLRIDVPTAPMPDRDSQFLEIDAYVRYLIDNPRTFLENLQNESTAGLRLGNLAISAIRDEVGLRDRKDIIGGDPITLDDGTITVEPRLSENGSPSREAMMVLVLERFIDSRPLRCVTKMHVIAQSLFQWLVAFLLRYSGRTWRLCLSNGRKMVCTLGLSLH